MTAITRAEQARSALAERGGWRLLTRQFNPLSSRLSPLRWFSDWRVERYYERTLHDSTLARRWARRYLEDLELPAGAAVLDHGCGRGRHVAILQQLGFNLAGQDVAPNPWWARLSGARLQVVSSDQLNLPWEDRSFALVLDVEVLHHLADERLASLAAEIFRVLQPGGYWILLEANDRGYGASAARRWYGRLHSLARVQNVARDAGFELVDVDFEGFGSQVMPALVNFTRKLLWPGAFDIADFDSSIAARIIPEKRAFWRLRLRRPL